MRSKRRRILVSGLAVLAAAAVALVLYLRADKTAELYATRGTYRGARLIEAYPGGGPTHQTSLPGTPYGAKPAKAQ